MLKQRASLRGLYKVNKRPKDDSSDDEKKEEKYNNDDGNDNNSQKFAKQRIELFVECRDLVKNVKDFNSKCDTFVAVFLKDNKYPQFIELPGPASRTEIIATNNSPKFAKQFRLDYYFEEEQIIRFDVYLVNPNKKDSKKLKDHTILGSCSMILGEIVHEAGSIIGKKLLHNGAPLRNKKHKKYSSLIATVEQVNQSGNELITMQFSCLSLPRMDGLFRKADPYYLVQRSREDGKWITVHGDRESNIEQTLNPTWPPFQIESQTLCNNDKYRPIKIVFYDWDGDGGDDYIGYIETTLNELSDKPQKEDIKREEDQKSKKKKNKTYGSFSVTEYKSKARNSFLDYIEGGAVDMSLMVSIDFTGSNGDSNDPTSLHYIYNKNNAPSQYQRAVRQIGNIVSVYDSDQKYPVWGFGASFSNVLVGDKIWNGVKHDFNLNFNPTDPEVHGIHGIEQCYLNGIKNNLFKLSGPTYFYPILKKAHRIARDAHKQNMIESDKGVNYFILLVITDGIIDDFRKSRDEIVTISNNNYPLSIIIIGVGDANFDKMEELDGDDGLKNTKGVYAERDIVQFVQMNKYKQLSKLSKETLIEIPEQFLSYVRAWDIVPTQKHCKMNSSQFIISNEELQMNEEMILLRTFSNVKDSEHNEAQSIDTNINYDNAPLPLGWEKSYNENGKAFYINHNTQKTQWKHPDSEQQIKPQNTYQEI